MKLFEFVKETIERWRVHLIIKYHLPLSQELLCLRVGIFFDQIRLQYTKVQISYLKKKLYVLEFVQSFIAFYKLFRAGFRIHNTVSNVVRGFEINRFYWYDQVIRSMPDIDRVDNHYNTIFNGHVENLS